VPALRRQKPKADHFFRDLGRGRPRFLLDLVSLLGQSELALAWVPKKGPDGKLGVSCCPWETRVCPALQSKEHWQVRVLGSSKRPDLDWKRPWAWLASILTAARWPAALQLLRLGTAGCLQIRFRPMPYRGLRLSLVPDDLGKHVPSSRRETESAYCGAREPCCFLPPRSIPELPDISPRWLFPQQSRGYPLGLARSLAGFASKSHSRKGSVSPKSGRHGGAPIDGLAIGVGGVPFHRGFADLCRLGLRNLKGFRRTKEVGSGPVLNPGLVSPLGPTGANVIRSPHRGLKTWSQEK